MLGEEERWGPGCGGGWVRGHSMEYELWFSGHECEGAVTVQSVWVVCPACLLVLNLALVMILEA